MSNKVILFADDSATMRTIMENTFAAEPYDVVAVPSGEMAITKSKEIQPAIIIADAGMVGVSGYDIYKAVSEESALSGVPVVIMAGVSDPYDENRGRELGITEYMKKPFDTTQLIEKVNELTAGVESVAQPEVSLPDSGAPDLLDEQVPVEKPLPSFQELTSRPPQAFPDPGGLIPPADKADDGARPSGINPVKPRPVTQSFEAVKPEPPQTAEQSFADLESRPAEPLPELEPVPVSPTPELEVEPIPIEEEEGDEGAFHVGTLAELAQMDGKGEHIPFESMDDAIDLPPSAPIEEEPDVPMGEPVDDEDDVAVVELLEEDEIQPGEEEAFELSEPSEMVQIEARAAAAAIVEEVDDLTPEQAQAITELAVEVIEKVVWEVVPDLAETIIREQLAKLLEE